MTAEQVPESASPALAEGLAAQITVIYSAAETEIITVIATRVRRAFDAADPAGHMLAGSRDVQTEAAHILMRTERESATAVRKALAAAYGRGHGRDRAVADGTLRNALERLRAIPAAVGQWVRSLWQRLIGVSASENDPGRRKVLAARTLGRAAARGVTAYTPSGQRTVVSLATEVVQHAAGGAAIDGFADRLTEGGGDLVIVTLSPRPCPICAPWEHKILSVTGDDPDRPSMSEAREGGLFHPRCRHTIVAWRPGFTWPPHSIEHLPGTYRAEQRQRAIERHIREWKLRDAAAIDDLTKLNAKRKVRAWEAALRQHIAAHGLQRSRQRERTDYGHTRPLTHAHGRRGQGEAGGRAETRPATPQPPAAPRGALGDLKAVAAADDKARHEKLLGGQTSNVEKVTLPDGRTAVHKTPRPGLDSPEEAKFFADGEELAANLGEAVGAPVAKVYRDGPGSVWVEWINGSRDGSSKLIDSSEGVRIGLLDALTGYADRNLMVRGGKLVAFDHGGSWLQADLGGAGPHLADPNAPMRHFVSGDSWRSDPPVSRAELDAIKRRIEKLRPLFAKAGRLDWLTYTLNALAEIKKRARR